MASGRPYLDPELNHGLMGLFVEGRTFRKPPDLTPRETEVLRLTAWGYSNKEIASRLVLSVKTVEVHKTNGMRKLGMNSRLQLVRYALLRDWFQDSSRRRPARLARPPTIRRRLRPVNPWPTLYPSCAGPACGVARIASAGTRSSR